MPRSAKHRAGSGQKIASFGCSMYLAHQQPGWMSSLYKRSWINSFSSDRSAPNVHKNKFASDLVFNHALCMHIQARETGICPVREELYAQCFDELIREVTINCAERGLLLLRIRDEMHMTIAAYQVRFIAHCCMSSGFAQASGAQDSTSTFCMRAHCVVKLQTPSHPCSVLLCRPCMRAVLLLACGKRCKQSKEKGTWKDVLALWRLRPKTLRDRSACVLGCRPYNSACMQARCLSADQYEAVHSAV